jgi:hypothetical protein
MDSGEETISRIVHDGDKKLVVDVAFAVVLVLDWLSIILF